MRRIIFRVLALALCALFGVSCSGGDDAGAGKTRGLLVAGGDSLGLAPPEGAEVLGVDAWVNERDKSALGWTWEDGVLEVVPGSGNLRTRKSYGDCRLHVEFQVEARDGVEWKNDGNSGVYIQRRYEVQILNSHGREVGDETCGAIYTQRKPDADVTRPAGEWQSFDIVFRQPRWEGGKKVEDARLSVLQNGVMIHDDVRLPEQTGSGKAEGDSPGPLRLQDHGSVVRFRNVWIEGLELD